MLQQWADTLYRLECHQEGPILWLNSDHQTIDQILATQASAGRRAGLREVFFDQIAHAVWSQLFIKAVADTEAGEAEEQGDLGEARYEWQQGVLAELLPAVVPEEPDDDARLRRVLAESHDDLSLTLERLDTALQRRNELVKHMKRLIEVSVG
jgi:hypothetical protein